MGNYYFYYSSVKFYQVFVQNQAYFFLKYTTVGSEILLLSSSFSDFMKLLPYLFSTFVSDILYLIILDKSWMLPDFIFSAASFKFKMAVDDC